MRQLTTYVSIASPWSYLGHAPLRQVAARHGATIRFRPIDLLAIFPESGGLPLAKRHPLRQTYREIELMRWRARRDVPLTLRPRHRPTLGTLADRVAVALTLQGTDPADYLAAAFRALWAEDRDLADEATLAMLLDGLGHAAEPLLALAQGKTVLERYAANGRDALEAGVFGAPTTILNGELFWGQDRIGFVDEALESGRPPIVADPEI